MAVWNDAEAPEPPANLTATLKGAVIHRFCETYSVGEEVEIRLTRSLEDVLAARQAELADRVLDIDREEALKELLPFARNYLASSVFQRIERARKAAGDVFSKVPTSGPGLWSELTFRLRRPLGILTGTIDKLLVSPSPSGKGFDIEIIDFKTNRIRPHPATPDPASVSSPGPQASRRPDGEAALALNANANSRMQGRRQRSHYSAAQFTLDFSEPDTSIPMREDTASNGEIAVSTSLSVEDQVRRIASDYQLQMQAYALAVRELMPDLVNSGSEIKVTLHFIDPNVEFHRADDLLEPDACARAIDQAFLQLISSREPEHFPIRPATHCRMCNFLQICAGGREWIAAGRGKGRQGDRETG